MLSMELKFDHETMPLTIPNGASVQVLKPNPVQPPESEEAELLRALENPIGTEKLRDMVKPWDTVAIVTSDITRPVPSKRILPFVLKELEKAGVYKENIVIVLAVGSHRGHSEEEKRMLLGDEVFESIRCVDACDFPYARIGTTSAGTPVDISEPVANADFRICIGNIEYHYFAGYSGGVKAIMPGVSSREAISANHRFMVKEEASAGRLEGNPIREDIEEAGKMLGVDFILNVVLNEQKQICRAFAGDSVKAHREGCRFLDTLYGVKIDSRADIVIACAGGFPKDINLYQTQKSLDNAKYAVKEGGTVILVGSAKEGYGEATFERWINEAETPDDLVRRVVTSFELGGHKAAAIAMVLQKADVYLVSSLSDEMVERAFLKSAKTVQEAYDAAAKRYGGSPSVIVMPYAASTLPRE